MKYASLSTGSQIRLMRGYAESFLTDFGVQGARLKCVNHGFNTTFSVEGEKGPEFALRINVNSKRTPAQLRAETELVRHLKSCGLRVATPQLALNGEAVLFREWEGTDRPLAAVLYSWLPGRNVGERVTPATAQKLGETMAALQRAALGITFSPQASLEIPHDLLFNNPNVMDPARFGLPDDAFEVSLKQCQDVYGRLVAQRAQPIHFDLHTSNVRWSEGEMAVLDFDDTVIANTLLDPAQTLYYIRSYPNWESLEAAFWKGLGWEPENWADLETLVAARQLLLCNDAIGMVNGDWEDWVPRYVRVSHRRMQLFLETGKFVTTPGTQLGFPVK